jgi:hypothetical protein
MSETAATALAALACALAAITGTALLGQYTGTPGLRTAAKQGGAVTAPADRSAEAGAVP